MQIVRRNYEIFRLLMESALHDRKHVMFPYHGLVHSCYTCSHRLLLSLSLLSTPRIMMPGKPEDILKLSAKRGGYPPS